MCGNIGPKGFSWKISMLKVCKDVSSSAEAKANFFTTPCGKNCKFVLDEQSGLIQNALIDKEPCFDDVAPHCEWCGLERYCVAVQDVALILQNGIDDVSFDKLLAKLYMARKGAIK